jgi:lipopolysaccharide export system protein LptA
VKSLQPYFKHIAISAMALVIFSVLPQDAQATVDVTAGAQIYAPANHTLQLTGGVHIATDKSKLSAGQANMTLDPSGQPKRVALVSGAKATSKSGAVTQSIQAPNIDIGLQDGGFKASGGVSTKLTGTEDVVIRSQNQALEKDKNRMVASGNVILTKGEMTATSPEAIIFLKEDGSADKLVFLKGAVLSQKGQMLRGETITLNLSTGDIYVENKADATLTTTNEKGEDSQVGIHSHLLEITKATGTVIANGNARIKFDDLLINGPKAVFYRKNEALEKIVMNGRSQVEDNERRVTGDRVTVLMNPKQFNAQGNVTTFIKSQQKKASPHLGESKPQVSNISKNTLRKPVLDTQLYEREAMIEKSIRDNHNN